MSKSEPDANTVRRLESIEARLDALEGKTPTARSELWKGKPVIVATLRRLRKPKPVDMPLEAAIANAMADL
jgi:hypothetical protein